ncbi:class I SAM-dependent methyltransferase [Candidatus Neomarinimicrobiota bacterium]
MNAKLSTLTIKVVNILRYEGIKEFVIRARAELHIRLKRLLYRLLPPAACKLCNGKTVRRQGYGRAFYQCLDCEFIFAIDYDIKILSRGMGMEGSWTGPGEGGYREYYLVNMLIQDLGLSSFLLYGTGNTRTFADLREEGLDVVGCDISPDVVEYKKATFGDDTFFTPDSLPANKTYDAIVAVEVFEHLADPKSVFSLFIDKLSPGGVICGTSNFYPGGPIEDDNKPGCMSIPGHVAYWSLKSMRHIAQYYHFAVSAFEMIRPGSVLPDEKYGQLWPNKRVFFVYDPSIHQTYFEHLMETTPILPIDKP